MERAGDRRPLRVPGVLRGCPARDDEATDDGGPNVSKKAAKTNPTPDTGDDLRREGAVNVADRITKLTRNDINLSGDKFAALILSGPVAASFGRWAFAARKGRYIITHNTYHVFDSASPAEASREFHARLRKEVA